MSKFFKERKSPWFLRKVADKNNAGLGSDSDDTGAKAEKSPAVKKDKVKAGAGLAPAPLDQGRESRAVEKRINLISKFMLGLALVILPFYFLPPIFPRFNFYFWRETALIVLALLLLTVFALRLLVVEGFTVLKNRTVNTLLGLTVLVLLLSVFFSRFRLGSLTSLGTWTYAAWAVILFVLVNRAGVIVPLKSKLLKAACLVSLVLVVLAWTLPLTPLFGSLPPAVSNNVQKPVLLDWRTSWNIAIDSFKQHPLLGFGPGLFEEAFQIHTPIFFNQSSNFNRVFYQTHWPFLGTLTTQGILAVVVWAVLLLVILKQLLFQKKVSFAPSDQNNKGEGGAFWQTRKVDLSTEAARVGSAVLIALIVVASALLFKAVKAELTFNKALAQVNQGQIGLARQTMGAAINQNIYADHYRRVYIQLGRAMVNLIAQQNKDEKGQISESASRDIRTLINQNMQQSRILTEKIGPLDARNWQVRGDTYRGLIGAASGADTWTLGAYNQAVQLSPVNPFLRIALGGVYLTLGSSAKASAQQIADAIQKGTKITVNKQEVPTDQAKSLQARQEEQAQTLLEQAAEQFRLAIVVKGDLPNAYYNWAAALLALDKKNQARSALEQTLALVKKDSPDYQKVQKDLERIQKELGIKVAKPKEQEQKLKGGKLLPQPTGQLQLKKDQKLLLPTPALSPTPLPTQALLPTFTPAP